MKMHPENTLSLIMHKESPLELKRATKKSFWRPWGMQELPDIFEES